MLLFQAQCTDPSTGSQKQDCEFGASLGYVVGVCLKPNKGTTTERTVLLWAFMGSSRANGLSVLMTWLAPRCPLRLTVPWKPMCQGLDWQLGIIKSWFLLGEARSPGVCPQKHYWNLHPFPVVLFTEAIVQAAGSSMNFLLWGEALSKQWHETSTKQLLDS